LLMGMIIVVGDDFSRRLRNRHRNVVELANWSRARTLHRISAHHHKVSFYHYVFCKYLRIVINQFLTTILINFMVTFIIYFEGIINSNLFSTFLQSACIFKQACIIIRIFSFLEKVESYIWILLVS
jgi:hypothetical protein